MKNKFTNALRENRILLLVIMISVLLSIFYGFQKNGLFLDELYSYGLSNSHYAPFVQDVKGGDFMDKVVTKQELSDYVTVQENQRFNYGSVYYNQSQDVHPPLFYFLLHTVCSFFPGAYSKWFGLGLNIFIFVGVLILLYKTANMLFKNKKISLLTTLIYGISNVAHSTVNMIRMYTLLTFFTLILEYLILKLLQKEKWYYYPAVWLTVFAGLLTQYYFVFYAFFVSAAVVLYLMAKKDFKKSLFFGLSALLGVVTMYICFPYCVEHLFAAKDVSATSVIGNFSNISMYPSRLFAFTRDLFKGMGAFFVVSLAGLVVVLINTKNNKPAEEDKKIRTNMLLLTIPALIAYVVAAIASPYEIIRYIYNIVPILALFMAYPVYRAWVILSKNKKIMYGTVAVVLVLSIVTVLTYETAWLYSNYETYDRIIEEQQGKTCIYITPRMRANEDSGVLSDLPQLLNFDEVFITDDFNSAELDAYVNKKDDGRGIVTYFHDSAVFEDYTREEILEHLTERFGYDGYITLFWEKDFSVSYLMYKE